MITFRFGNQYQTKTSPIPSLGQSSARGKATTAPSVSLSQEPDRVQFGLGGQRITEDSISHAIQKLVAGTSDASFGHYSALFSLQRMMKAAATENDPKGVQLLISLDLAGIQGDDISTLFIDVCKTNPQKAVKLVNQYHVGLVSRKELEQILVRKGEGFDLDEMLNRQPPPIRA